MVTSARKPEGTQGRKGWSNHLNAAITQLLTFQVSFLRRNWKQSSNTEKHMEIIIMAEKQKQKSFYVPPFDKSLILKQLLHWLKPTPQGRG